jgi:hypothetical protein
VEVGFGTAREIDPNESAQSLDALHLAGLRRVAERAMSADPRWQDALRIALPSSRETS